MFKNLIKLIACLLILSINTSLRPVCLAESSVSNSDLDRSLVVKVPSLPEEILECAEDGILFTVRYQIEACEKRGFFMDNCFTGYREKRSIKRDVITDKYIEIHDIYGDKKEPKLESREQLNIEWVKKSRKIYLNGYTFKKIQGKDFFVGSVLLESEPEISRALPGQLRKLEERNQASDFFIKIKVTSYCADAESTLAKISTYLTLGGISYLYDAEQEIPLLKFGELVTNVEFES